jgi:hypothetical protein
MDSDTENGSGSGSVWRLLRSQSGSDASSTSAAPSKGEAAIGGGGFDQPDTLNAPGALWASPNDEKVGADLGTACS